MDCTILWDNFARAEWEKKFLQLRRVPVTQSEAYAFASAKIYGQRPRWGIISINGQEAGLVQMMEAGLFGNLIHALIIDRGPSWFEGFGTPEHISAFWQEINRQFPRRFGRKRRFIPETGVREEMRSAGLEYRDGSAYETIWLDLTRDLEDIRAGLKKNWRGALNKAERAGLEIEWDNKGALIPWFLQIYAVDKAIKDYSGASAKFLRSLSHSFAAKHAIFIGRAKGQDGQPAAGVMILLHGTSATYQAGWSGEAGRDTGAHHILLWQAIERLKQRGVKDFDLGGVNENAAGVKQFKEGLLGKGKNGESVKLSGIFY